MPNPLSALMSSSGTTAKPDATPQDSRAPKAAASFQMVMDQESGPRSAEPYLIVPESDVVPELEDIVPDDEIADIPVAPEDQPPAELHVAAPEAVEIPVAKEVAEKPSVSPQIVKSETPSIAEANPVMLHPDASRPPESSAQRAVSPAVQTMVTGTVPPRGTPETATLPMNFQIGLATPNAHPKETFDISPFYRSERNVPASPTTPPPAQSQPVTPGQAPTLTQLQLLASDQTTTQAEIQPNPEAEEVRIIRETAALPTARESTPIAPAMTATARAETARAIANQMATVVSAHGQPGTIEVALNPEELGRVSIVLNGREDGLHMTISAERPETLDMMRRHLSVLEAEFQNFGLGDLSLNLGTSADAQHDGSDTNEGHRVADTPTEPGSEVGPAIPKLGPDGRIDMRL